MILTQSDNNCIYTISYAFIWDLKIMITVMMKMVVMVLKIMVMIILMIMAIMTVVVMMNNHNEDGS